jgi:two-component system catabolic regulation response regulator CreB
MPQVLLLEDDPAIAETVVFALRREGFEVQHHLLVREAHHHAQQQRPDVAILDVGLPDGNGMDLCRQWRAATDPRLRALPVLMLTARAEEMDRVIALETGADDYLTKPFSPRELVARLRALLRRSSLATVPAPAAAALFELDEDGQRIRFGGHTLALTRMEFRLLATLLSAPGRIRSREWLLDQVWGLHSEATDRTVDTHVKTLRAKLRECRPDLEPIATHRGLGYALELPPVPGG